MVDYPFLHNLTNLLIEIGYHGKLSEGADALLLTEIPACTAVRDETGKTKGPKISYTHQMDCLRFLTLCGFTFTGINLENKAAKGKVSSVSYPPAPALLIGLKALSVAYIELRTGQRYWTDLSFLRCDYRALGTEDANELGYLRDFVQPLLPKVQDFVLKLHHHQMDMGMTCVIVSKDPYEIAYSYIKNSRRTLSPRDIYQLRVFEFTFSMKYGYCMFVRAKKTNQYPDVIKTFPPHLQEKIARGYACDRKYGERCQNGCKGILIPLDDSILGISGFIKTWLDNELPSAVKRKQA
jgi:hypothetical protein